jgi:hypothetical protein
VIVLTAIFTAERLHSPLVEFGEAYQNLTPQLLRDALARVRPLSRPTRTALMSMAGV